ncbi:hypothetical protein KKI24_04940 [bacterium]|nr:hypothetical protein [bacterium]
MNKAVQYSKKENKLVIRGILVPEDWDSSSQITKMAICTSGEQEFLIEMDSLGKELSKYKGLKAVLNGKLKDTDLKRKTIIVDQYEIHQW